jgi:hypothetical protein
MISAGGMFCCQEGIGMDAIADHSSSTLSLSFRCLVGLVSGLVSGSNSSATRSLQLDCLGCRSDCSTGRKANGSPIRPKGGHWCCGVCAGLSCSHCSMIYFIIAQKRWVSEIGFDATLFGHCAWKIAEFSSKAIVQRCRGHFCVGASAFSQFI